MLWGEITTASDNKKKKLDGSLIDDATMKSRVNHNLLPSYASFPWVGSGCLYFLFFFSDSVSFPFLSFDSSTSSVAAGITYHATLYK
jgi:hypothetical protein